MSGFLARANTLIENGYRIIQIRHNSKKPVGDVWQESHTTVADLEKWTSGGNIGILTENTPAVDLDIYDADMAQLMEDAVLSIVGGAPARVGQFPKRLVVYRTDTPFRKLWCTYADKDGDKHKVEILGKGQQFVAYGVHPDTKREYEWTSLDEPLDTPTSALPTLTPEKAQAILDAYEQAAESAGWTKIGRSGEARTVGEENEDGLERIKRVLALTTETIKDTLDTLTNDEADYDDWLEIGMALHHQFGGDEEGLQLWHEWGQYCTKYNAVLTNKKWGSFGHGPNTATFATLLYKAKIKRAAEADKAFETLLVKLRSVSDRKKVVEELLPKIAEAALTDLNIDIAVKRLQERIGEIDGAKPRLETIRKMFLAARPKLDLIKREMPKWCENWVYLALPNMFYSTKTGSAIGARSFDAMYGRELLDDAKRAAGEAYAGKASDFALNLYEIPQVLDTIYLPGESLFLTVNRNTYVNTYDESSVPAAKAPTTADDFDAVSKIERHFEVLIPDDGQRRILIDYLAYNVQFTGEKINWAVVLQGVDGGGKTFLADLMAACLGGENVRSIPGQALKETNTAWAEGKKMVFVEEIRLHGDNKFEILDKVRPYITNLTASIRRMGRDYYDIPNVTDYVFFTNYLDGLPINRNDRRYFILRTSFQTVSHIDKFNAENPSYFSDLYAILSFNSDVVRHWFLNYPISDNFKPKGKAPDTEDKHMMREASEDDEAMETLNEILAESEEPELTDRVLNASKLREVGGLGGLGSRSLGNLLARAGFALVGRYRLWGKNLPNVSYYTRHSELFGADRPEDLRCMIERPAVDDGFGD